MEETKGWLLDVYIQGAAAVLWIKTEDLRAIRLVDRYAPFFHIEPAEGQEDELLYRVSESPHVRSACVEEKLTSLDSGRTRRLIKVEPYDTCSFKILLRLAERNPLVSGIYNTGMRHVQRYLLKLGVEPTSKVAVSFDGDKLTGIKKLDDSCEVPPPPFSLMLFSLDYCISREGRSVKGIRSRFKGKANEFRGEPCRMLAEFKEHLLGNDPDLLLCPKCDRISYPLLRSAFRENGVDFHIGRCSDADQVRLQGSFAGRILMGDVFYGFSTDEWGIAGLVERTRFSFAPIGLGTRWLSNRSMDSRGCLELLRRGYAIPREEYFEDARALTELTSRDRGGITITPEAGVLHENVAALDFDSQYPNIIVKNNLSYECTGAGADAGESAGIAKGEGKGILPSVISPWLNRRLWLKGIRRNYAPGTPERVYCEERVDALKMILVCAYGLSGCCRNRFGNVLTFEEINKKSRECMLKAKTVAESEGFRIVYGDVDSIFLTRSGAGREDYEALAAEIAKATDLPMSLDRHFRFVAFLPLKGDPSSSALKRYFGLTFDGKVVARGIELRRSDTPEFIKDFQEKMIRRVMESRDLGEARSEGVRRGIALLNDELTKLREGIDLQSLIVNKRLGKATSQYKACVCQKSAAMQLLQSGREIEVGDYMPFIYTDHGNADPLCRVKVPELFADSYDVEMYSKLLREAALTVLRGIGMGQRLDAAPTLERWISKSSSA